MTTTSSRRFRGTERGPSDQKLTTRHEFRPDVEGLRAVAVLLVVAYHAGISLLPGGFVGVDVFFVISGFLITGLLVGELGSRGTISIPGFYARRVRRLLPAIVVMVVVVAALAYVVLSPLRRAANGADVIASGLFVANWRFASQAVDYLASQAEPSAMLHMWSLSVEEQYYLVWPALLIGLAAVHRVVGRAWTRGWFRGSSLRSSHLNHRVGVSGVDQRVGGSGVDQRVGVPGVDQRRGVSDLDRRVGALGVDQRAGSSDLDRRVGASRVDRGGSSLRVVLVVATVVILVASFGLSLWQTGNEAGLAYFSSLTRAWELALGGLLALSIPLLRRFPRPVAALAGWAGLLAILVAGVRLDETVPFPGTAALLPTLGAAAVLLAGVTLPGDGAGRLLSTAPMRHIGRLSYGWYLWHWPLLVLAAAWAGHELSWTTGVLIVAFAYLLAELSLRFVEDPVRRAPLLARSNARSLVVGLLCTATVVTTGLVLRVGTEQPSLAPDQALGAAVLPDASPRPGASPAPAPTLQASAVAVLPAPSDAGDDLPAVYKNGCHRQFAETSVDGCVFGDPDSATTVVLFGDSHAATWFPPLVKLAKQNDWRLVSMTKSGCPAKEVTPYNSVLKRAYTECATWRQNAFDRIAREHPALVFTTSINGYSVTEDGVTVGDARGLELETAGWVSTLQTLSTDAQNVVLLRDVPDMGEDPPSCVSEHLDDLARCAVPRKKAIVAGQSDELAQDELGNSLPDLHFLDLNDEICLPKVCPSVIGNVLVYRDKDHLTATYTTTMAPSLLTRLRPYLP